MKKNRVASIFVGSCWMAVLTGCAAQSAQNSAADDINVQINTRVSTEMFAQNLDTGDYVVLDVRTQSEYDADRIVNDAINIDFYADDFRTQLNALPKDEKYLLYCRSGNRSGQTLRLMKDLGFAHVEELSGGISAWQSAGHAVVSE